MAGQLRRERTHTAILNRSASKKSAASMAQALNRVSASSNLVGGQVAATRCCWSRVAVDMVEGSKLSGQRANGDGGVEK